MLNNKGFISIILFFLIVAIALAVAPIIMQNISYHAVSEQERAFFVADSGIRYYIKNQLVTDKDWRDNAGLSKNFGGGSFTIAVVGPNPRERARIIVRSTGSVTVGSTSFQRTIEQVITSNNPFNSSIYGIGPMTLNGLNSMTVNGDINISGTLTNINSNLTVNGATNTNVPNLTLPTVQWSYWQTLAQSYGAGYVITGNYTFPSSIPSGVYYINGNATIQNTNNATYTITVVATGDINITGNNKMTLNPAASGKPTLISGHNISYTNSNQNNVGGTVYAANNLLMGGTSNLNMSGTLIYGGQMTCQNSNKPIVTNPDPNAVGDGFSNTPPAFSSFKEI